MANKMFIDAAHPEETRVVVMRGNRVQEFDFESAARRQLRGNIYLAKVTRVEPSLQAAFVDYGGNRHGFLALNEIHPDYYQIPIADRQALLEQDAADEIAAEALENGNGDTVSSRTGEDDMGGTEADKSASKTGAGTADKPDADGVFAAEGADTEDSGGGSESTAGRADKAWADAQDEPGETENGTGDRAAGDGDEEGGDSEDTNGEVESVGSDDALEEAAQRKVRHQRAYKIQEVIKRRQVILVQVVKEERGTKGAALTTYLSLAGRYCVLMPNTARGGGISRKITNPADRRRLKEVAAGLEVPEGMGLIVRTAGANRTKAEIKRDFEYLLRLWENVRDLTLQSSAPSLVYEEGSLIKRSIRDLYNKDVDTVSVEGEEAYREAKDFMRMLMPSHAKNVQAYKEPVPIFMRNQIEPQLDALFSSHCGLKSGGYLVINQTEALVAIDVNSGKATKEHNIEDTALQTNLEAAEEIARQLRLRDLAGLIVIDFIDMEEKRNNRAVERRLKDRLKDDRARIQVGRISHFGLLEMSRQRMRAGMLEGSTLPCPACQGRGFVRSVESASLHILRGIEAHVLKSRTEDLSVRAPTEMVLYIINNKRDHLLSIEARHGISITLDNDDALTNAEFKIGSCGDRQQRRQGPAAVVQIDSVFGRQGGADAPDGGAEDEDDGRRKRRRRRRGRRRGRDDAVTSQETDGDGAEAETVDLDADDDGADEQQDGRKPKRRRGKRGGRRNRKKADLDTAAEASEMTDAISGDAVESDASEADAGAAGDMRETAEKPARKRRGRRSGQSESAACDDDQGSGPPEDASTDEQQEVAAGEDGSDETEADPPKPMRRSRRQSSRTDIRDEPVAAADISENAPDKSAGAAPKVAEDAAVLPLAVEPAAVIAPPQKDSTAAAQPAAAPETTPAEPAAKPRRGWWRRRSEASD